MALPIVYRSTDVGKWGTGKDSKLTIIEGDTNLWEIDKAITDLQSNPPSAISIANIQVVGSAMQITLTNGATSNFTLPVAMFRYREEGFVDGVEYKKLDLIPVADQGLYLVLQDHTGVDPFDPAEQQNGSDLYQLQFGQDQSVRDVRFSISGKPGEGLVGETDAIASYIVTDTCYALQADNLSKAYLQVGSDAELVMKIQQNAEDVGTITFNISNVAIIEWTADTQFEIGDMISIIAPDTVDDTAKGLVVALALFNGNLP